MLYHTHFSVYVVCGGRFVSDRREHDLLKAKYASLEDKIRRQEAYMKNRLLRDKSANTLHVPDAGYHAPTKASQASSTAAASAGGAQGDTTRSSTASAVSKSSHNTGTTKAHPSDAGGSVPIRVGRHIAPNTIGGTMTSADDSRVKFLSSLAQSHHQPQHHQPRHRDINVALHL